MEEFYCETFIDRL